METLSKISLAFEHGGFWMWPILIFQLVSIAIVIERVFALYVKRKVNQAGVAQQFEDSIKRGDIHSVIQKAQPLAAEYGVARATLAGALAAQRMGGKEEVQAKMDEVLAHENSQLDKRIGFLSMLGNVATLTGLLGTITGMIKSFAAVAYANPAEKAALLAAGISEAMNATAFGLIVAIPALILYAVLQNRSNQLIEDLNQSALRVFNWLSYSYEPAGFKTLRTVLVREDSTQEINA